MHENQASQVSMKYSGSATAPRTSVVTTKPRQQRWEEEAAFFDEVALKVSDRMLLIDPLAIQRYSAPGLRRRFNMEFRYKLMGPLQGKRILDVGCGDGLNAVILAMLGADVTGIDISPKAIEVARRRAELNNVSHKAKFICSPIETAALPDKYFDIVWGDGVLHHVIDELEPILQYLRRSLKSDGYFLFAEPVNLCQPLRQLRKMAPERTDVTPGERPLLIGELDLVGRHTAKFHKRYFGLFGRFDQFILTSYNYERSSPFQRFIVNCIDLVDYALLSLPGIQRLASTCVMYGKPGP